MQRSAFFLFTFLAASAAGQTDGLLDRIGTVERAVPALNQTLTGTWMLELRRPGQTLLTPSIVTYLAEGSVIGPTADGTSSSSQGLWIRVADRKFLQTMYIFNYDEKRVLTTIAKVRITVQLSEDGQTVKGTTEGVVLDRDGHVIATIPGGAYTGVRLTVERPADFETFLKDN